MKALVAAFNQEKALVGVTHHHQEQDGVTAVIALQHAGPIAGLLAWTNKID